jgi:hypothetical protein
VDLGQAEDNFPSFVLLVFIVLPSNFFAFKSKFCKPFHEGESGHTSASGVNTYQLPNKKNALKSSLICWEHAINNTVDNHRVIFTGILDVVLFIPISLAKVLRSNSKAANVELYLIHLQKSIHSILNDISMTLRAL